MFSITTMSYNLDKLMVELEHAKNLDDLYKVLLELQHIYYNIFNLQISKENLYLSPLKKIWSKY